MPRSLRIPVRVLLMVVIASLLAFPIPAVAQTVPTTVNVLMYTNLCPAKYSSSSDCDDYYRTATFTATGIDVSFTATAGWGTGGVDNATWFADLQPGTYEFVLHRERQIRGRQMVTCLYQGSSTPLVSEVVRNRVVLTLDHPGDVDCAWLVESVR